MKSLKSYRSVLLMVLISYLFQILCVPLSYAQRGVFVRESDLKKQGERKSFRTLENEEDETYAPLPSTLGGRGGMEGALQRRGTEGAEGMGGMAGPSLGAGGLIYQVHVLGEVKRPGTYRVPASTRLSETLLLAGGIKKNGSERNIELRRSSSSRKMDLLAYRVLGQLEDNPYLMDNDVVYVPLKQKVIEVEGAVNRPGIYEVKNERRVSDVVRLAGGFTQGVSHKDPVKIIRYDQDEKKNIIDVANSPEELKQAEIISGDVIVVPHMFTTKNEFDYNLKELPRDNVFYPSYEDRVFIIGAVEVPGAYDFNQYYKLSNYLALAGGMNRMAKGHVKIVTENGKAEKVKPDDPVLINPGDTIYVPEKALSRETWISILTTVASLGLTSAALFTR
jgi:protein involved in polysaccharide export with SLBB domain